MIDVIKLEGKLIFKIGPHTFPVTQDEAVQIRDMIANYGTDGHNYKYRPFSSLRMETAGAFDHPWESRPRVIFYYKSKKWHLTLMELSELGKKFTSQIGE